MTDQAADLRALAGPAPAGTGDTAKIIAVASGKGGVGKSTLVGNLRNLLRATGSEAAGVGW